MGRSARLSAFLERWLRENPGKSVPTAQIAADFGCSPRSVRRELAAMRGEGPGGRTLSCATGSAPDPGPGGGGPGSEGGADAGPPSDRVRTISTPAHAPPSESGRQDFNPQPACLHASGGRRHAGTSAREIASLPAAEGADLRRLVALAWRVWGEPHAYSDFHLRPLVGLLPGALALRYLQESKKAPDVLKFTRYPLQRVGNRERAIAWIDLQNSLENTPETKVSTEQMAEKSPEKESLEGKKGEPAPVQLPPIVLQLDERHAPAVGPSIALDTDGEAPAVAGCEPGRPVPGSGWSGVGIRVWGGFFYFRRNERQMWSPQGRVSAPAAGDRAPGEASARSAPRSAAGGPVLGLAPVGGGGYLGGAPRREAAE